MNRIGICFLWIVIFVCYLSNNVYCQPEPPEGMPIDGGISYLIAAGLIYGGKKAYDQRKSDK